MRVHRHCSIDSDKKLITFPKPFLFFLFFFGLVWFGLLVVLFYLSVFIFTFISLFVVLFLPFLLLRVDVAQRTVSYSTFLTFWEFVFWFFLLLLSLFLFFLSFHFYGSSIVTPRSGKTLWPFLIKFLFLWFLDQILTWYQVLMHSIMINTVVHSVIHHWKFTFRPVIWFTLTIIGTNHFWVIRASQWTRQQLCSCNRLKCDVPLAERPNWEMPCFQAASNNYSP